MLNLGLIGDIQLLEPLVKMVRENQEIHITGKSSVGTIPTQESFRFSAPEFNRIELTERSDALLINRFSLLPFQMLCDMVKKSKHFFAASYPTLNPDECNHLAKLASEAKTVIQFTNPFFYLPPVQWLNQNLKKPAFIEVTLTEEGDSTKLNLIQILLMVKNITGSNPKKISALMFESKPADERFTHFQIEYSDGTNLSVKIWKKEGQNKFNIKSFARDQFTTFDLLKTQGTCNNSPVHLSDFEKENEPDIFLRAIVNRKNNYTNIEDYSAVLQTIQLIQAKLERYIHQ